MAMGFLNERSSLQTDPIRNFRYVVKFLPIDASGAPKFSATLGFSNIDGLQMTTEPIPYREGGYNTTLHMIPGQTQFSPVSMQRGVTLGSSQHWNWLAKTFNVDSFPSGSGSNVTPTTNFRCNVRISVLAHPVPLQSGMDNGDALNNEGNKKVAMRFRLRNAWPTSIQYSPLNAGDSGLLVEGMTLVHEGLAVDWASDANSYLSMWGDDTATKKN